MKTLSKPHAKIGRLPRPLLVAGLLVIAALSHAADTLYKTPLNDTGLTTCYYYRIGADSCPVPELPGQDAEYGRDKTHNDKKDGRAGFSFTKINRKGQAVAAKAPSWNCVKDNVTGLMWEVKTSDRGLHDRRWTYSWYQPDDNINGGDAGVQNGGKCFRKRGCDTYHFVVAVNQQGWCGYRDWRLATMEELANVSDFSGLSRVDLTPVPDVKYFPDAKMADVTFWSSTPSNDSSAWYAGYDYFKFGAEDKKNERHHVRLVRGGQ